MARILRGEIYWADLEPVRGHEQGGLRPILVLSHDVFNERSETVITMAITSQAQRAGYPLSWQVPIGVLPKESWVKVSQIRLLAAERLRSRVGRLADDELQEIIRGLLQLMV